MMGQISDPIVTADTDHRGEVGDVLTLVGDPTLPGSPKTQEQDRRLG